MQRQPEISVVIVNWNGAAHLHECLEGLADQTVREATEVIVVDNGSTDASRELLSSQPDVRLVRNEINRGFATACNQGIRAARGRYIALLNNDVAVDSRWLEELLAVLRDDPRAGWCTSKILSYYDRSVFDNAGHVVFADGLTRGRGRLERDRGQYDAIEEVFSASGCAALVRREMLDDVGLLDDAFFAYCEDADLGFRARLRGWRCLYVPAAVVYHKFSASSHMFSELKALNVERNRAWLAIKNLPAPLLLASVFHTARRYFWQAWGALSGRGASGRFTASKSRGALALILCRAWSQALRGVPRVLRQRREIQRRRRVSTAEVRALLRRFGISARRIALME